MQTPQPQSIFLKDYTPPAQLVTHVDMVVKLHPTATVVETVLHVTPREAVPLLLNGEGLELIDVQCNGHPAVHQYADDILTVTDLPTEPFKLSVIQRCNPQANTALSGLYLSNGVYCTQMEAQGFRRFAFMQDRPDVMATYHVRLEAPHALPVLLANGNPVAAGQTQSGHFAEWDDPHPKPTYLFAIVAGDLAHVADSFKTSEGRNVALGIYVEKGKEDRCAWAMESLKASMRWDEEKYGRAYDLDVFNIVAVSDFNMGAMENKGLNIFNDKYVLARPDTATDVDYINIERIIAHEYFHNWTGNRITCRDWFQLCLKEGLTVYRDQEFTADMRSRAVKRIDDVKTLRARQFPEDQGPLAHAVRPSSYIEINNFYTPTVYEKGAEICRMLHTLVGAQQFRKAMDLYFERHDGEAATVEDFLACFAKVSGRDLQQFSLWYAQAGTPVVHVDTAYDEAAQRYEVRFAQITPDTPGQTGKLPMHLPLRLGLIGADGNDLPLQPEQNLPLEDGVFELTEAAATLTFRDVRARPVLSINRGFSAPIVLTVNAANSDLQFQLAHDSDSFNRWEAAQTLARRIFVAAYRGEPHDIAAFAHGLSLILRDGALDAAFKALMLSLPGEAEIAASLAQDVDATRVNTSRRELLAALAAILKHDLEQLLLTTQDALPYVPDTASAARRSLRLSALGLLARADPQHAVSLAEEDFASASNMTIEAGVLAAVVQVGLTKVDDMLSRFHARHAADPLLVDKWFAMMAARPDANAAQRIERLTQHSAFSFKTPNRVYALIGGFTSGNLSGFHAVDGLGYELLADVIITLNSINPQVASRMATSFRSWRLYDGERREKAAKAMQRVLAAPALSPDVYEIISRTLG
jgi:aminopeptidase N